MAEPQDAVLPILKSIQQDISAIKTEQKAQAAKLNNIAETVMETNNSISEIRRDNLMHLGMTARQRVDFDELKAEVQSLKSRLAALESRS